MIRIRYEPTGIFRAVAVRFVPPRAFTLTADVTPICTLGDSAIEIRRLRCNTYLRYAGELLERRMGPRPFLLETDADVASSSRDGIQPFALQSACDRKGDEGLIRYELVARSARMEIEFRRGESNHARMSRLAATRAAEI